MEDLNQEVEEDMKKKLEVAVREALDDETYKKIKRMSYQSHNADEVIHSIGLDMNTRSGNPISSGTMTPQTHLPKASNLNEIAILDKLLASLLGNQKRTRSFTSHCGTPRSSYLPVTAGLRSNGECESWPDTIYENTIVQNVLANLRSQQKESSVEESFMTPE